MLKADYSIESWHTLNGCILCTDIKIGKKVEKHHKLVTKGIHCRGNGDQR
jgi:hypothetical protein